MRVLKNTCSGCGKTFMPGQEIYTEELLTPPTIFIYCEECFTTALMLRLDDIDPDAWRRPASQLYQILFPGEKTSRYVKPLVRAMTILWLKNESWEEQDVRIHPKDG